MKRIILLFCGVMMIAATGCNFLDVVPDDTATLADAFKNEQTAEGFLFTCYSYQLDSRDYTLPVGLMTTNEMTSEIRLSEQFFPFKTYNLNKIGSSSTEFGDIRLTLYQGIRQCHTFLENIDGVHSATLDAAVFEGLKNNWKGEALFLVAYYHHRLFQSYGPCVLVKGTSNERQPRSSVDECVNTIAAWYDEAIELLPATTGSAEYGRANQMVAKAMKAQLLLYAASPLFNGDPEGVFSNADPKFRELMTLQRDNARWERALTAIDEAITFAETEGGRRLYEFTGVDPVTNQPVVDPQRKAYLNLRNIITDHWNIEMIFANGGTVSGWESMTVPKGLNNRSNAEQQPVSGFSPTLAAVKIFYSANGLPLESDPARGYEWTETGRMTIPAGENTCNLHLNREQRFYAAIGYDSGIYEYNSWTEYVLNFKRGRDQDDRYTQGLRVGGNGDENQLMIAINNSDRLESGYAVKKTAHPKGICTPTVFEHAKVVFPLMRLADLYLQYAEACAEAKVSLDDKAKGYIEKIHNRAGLNGANFYYRNYTGAQLVEAVRRERMIELIFESHWHFDLRRWEMAEKWHNGQMWCTVGYPDTDGMWGLNIVGLDNASFYKEVNRINDAVYTCPYKFDKRMYFLPIYINHLNINDLLVQNPGY